MEGLRLVSETGRATLHSESHVKGGLEEMFRRQLLAAGIVAFTFGATAALGGGDVGKALVAPSGWCRGAEKGGLGPGKLAPTAHAARYVTILGRLDAYYRRSVVGSRIVTIRAASKAEFENALAREKSSFARALDERGQRWDRIEFVPLRIEGCRPHFSGQGDLLAQGSS
jgi:hypothetical protein